MIKKIVCWGKSKIGLCNYYGIRRQEEEIRVGKICLENINKLQKRIGSCVSHNNIDEVLRFKGKFIDEYYWYETKDKEMNEKNKREDNIEVYLSYTRSNCNLNYETCNEKYEKNKNIIEQLQCEFKKKIEKYNKELSIIKKVQNYCQDGSECEYHSSKEVYFKFGRDKYNDLIALYFNINQFLRKEFEPIEDVFVFSGEGECPYNDFTVLHLKYETCHLCICKTEAATRENLKVSHAHICDFKSYNPKKGHGTFILKNLEDIIKRVNKRFLELKEDGEESFYKKTTLRAINGEVFPDGSISYDDLVKFYNKNGLPTIGKTYDKGGYVEDRIIYKKVY